MAASGRWRRFCRHAAERGIQSSLSLPLIVRDRALGALNLYSTHAHAFDDGDTETGLMFASQAAVALANAQTYAAALRLAGQLRDALGSRATIDQAIGAVMAQAHCDADDAFERLKATSQRSHRKLRLVAEAVIDAAQRGEALPL
jgi:signal transduction protein with GAF and PtsI domain